MNNKKPTTITENKLEISNSNLKLEEKVSEPVFISQEKNYANKHGFHYRSSAQFYFEINKK